MATPGYTLAGFMPQHEGVLHLRQRCKWQDDSDAALIGEWSAAKARLGPPVQNAGNPSILDIPVAEQPYLAQLQSQQWLKERMPPGAPPFVFKLVEIAPLLAYQHVIDSGRSAHHCATFNQSTPLLELMQTCLPMTPQAEKYSVELGEKSASSDLTVNKPHHPR